NGDKYADALRESEARGQVSVRLANGTVVNVPGVRMDLVVKVEDFDSTESFLVLDMDKYDLILGMPWLEKHEPWIDWRGKGIGANRPAVSDRALVRHVPTSVRVWGTREGHQGVYAPEEVTGVTDFNEDVAMSLATGHETKAHCQACGIAAMASPNAERRRTVWASTMAVPGSTDQAGKIGPQATEAAEESAEGAVEEESISGVGNIVPHKVEETEKKIESATCVSSVVNGDTPAVNKVLGRCLELKKTRSNWMLLSGRKLVCRAIWMDLGGELAVPIDSTSTRQVAQDTVLLLRAMGCEPQRFTSDAALKDWTPTDAGTALGKWKKKLRTSFGVSEIGAGRQPIARRAPEASDTSKIPLPQPPKKRVNEGSDTGVFTATAEASPYMQDSPMVTPRSASRSERLAEEPESLRPTPNTRQEAGRRPARNYNSPEDSSDSDSDSGDFDYLDGDLTEEWARQTRELSKAETKSSTPRLELATHLPLGNIKPYFGLRNKSEKSMQWLRTFIYEMKGTHTPPNEWCMAFELSLQDGALHWYPQLPRKTCRPWKLLSDAFIKYYCSRFTQSANAIIRLNGYACNAGVQFENGERDAKDHVEHFLDTCDNRGLEERLCHVRVKDIHDLEDMVNDILRRRERKTSRESSGRRPKNQEDGHRHDGRRTEGSRDSYRSDRLDREHRRDDSRPSVTVANALTELAAASNMGDTTRSRSNRPETRQHGYDSTETSSEDKRRRDGSRGSSEGSDSDSSNDGEYGRVAAANDNERRAAAEGTFAGPTTDTPGAVMVTSTKTEATDETTDSAIGLCKQVHDAGKGGALNELTDLIRSKVDKKDLTPELQSLELPQLTEPAIDADYIFAFAGEVNWPEDREITSVTAMETEKERGANLGECEKKGWSTGEPSGRKTEGSIVSERLGRWSSQRYDKRKRMRALAKGAVNDVRTRILLDTGANVSVISANYAKRLRLREVPDHGRSLEVRGINHAKENDASELLANDIELTDYAQELTFFPDLTEITVTALDYTGPNVQNKDLDVGQQRKLVDVLKRHEKIMISSGNALPPAAYGVVCDIDLQGHAPIKQRTRRTPLRFLGKLYELLKGLLQAGLITFSDSLWASPIVIVVKKNGVDIRLCTDYKMMNAVTAIMEYAMPLVDDLLTDREAYL
ncbi:Hypothetical protein PHPALM_6773, partial [Phytophthora palmivora]